MLTYTFTRREKALILVLAVILLAIAWFILVFQNTTNEVTRLESEIMATQTQADAATTRIAQQDMMKAAIAEYEASGARMVDIPTYDNVEPLMAELDGIMGAAETYTLSFEALDRETSNQYILRGVRIDFGCDTYDQAERIVRALADGAYPCVIRAVSISDSSVGSRARNASATGIVTASVNVTFIERYPVKTAVNN